MSHTPGPWSLSTESVYATRVDGPDGNKVALAQYLLSEGRSIPEAIANARLISAAPDLLEALERVIAPLEIAVKLSSWRQDPTPGECSRALEGAKAAIAKAKGEAQL